MQTSTLERPAQPAGATTPPGLARQQRDREKAIRRVAKLRARAADEIDRLLAFLDASDPYAATELENAVDDDPCDTDELEMGWTGVTAGAAISHQDWIDEAEADGAGGDANDEESDAPEDGADAEPSLCGVTANGVTGDSMDREYDAAFDDLGSTPPEMLAAARARAPSRPMLRWPDGRPFRVEDLATMPSNVTVLP